MDAVTDMLKSFFGVALRGQTYLNALYLLLAFPLGLFYFIFFVVGLSTGISLVIVWVGLLILAGVFAAWYGLIAFERRLTIELLREDIPPVTRQDTTGMTLWQKSIAFLKNPVAWKGLAYLLARFPLGILSFVVLVTLLSVSLAFIAAPLYYFWAPAQFDMTLTGAFYLVDWRIDTLPEASLVSLLGFLVLVGSLHVFNWMAWLSGKFAWLMLGNFSEPAKNLPAAANPPASLEQRGEGNGERAVPAG